MWLAPPTRLAQGDILEPLAEIVVARDQVQVILQPQHGQDAEQDGKTDREFTLLEAMDRGARRIHPRGQFRHRQSTPEPSQPQTLAQGIRAPTRAWENRASDLAHDS